ncbi:hypothetical protein AB2B41_05420 [Marimonas sp. MJW-29]|uniref:Uncharacterized protein n=1 Tax=Sulfitobacter sediminis TaxID=3234186 RepID=A0ABV3RJ84_9RHOB
MKLAFRWSCHGGLTRRTAPYQPGFRQASARNRQARQFDAVRQV